MSAPMDVLAVLDEAQDWLYRSSESCGDDARAESVKQACAAVAELIEASRAAVTEEGVTQLELDRLRTALARVGGAS